MIIFLHSYILDTISPEYPLGHHIFCTFISKTRKTVIFCLPCSRDYQGKRVNPPYRPSNQGNSSKVIFRHSTQLFRGCYSRDAWTAEAIFSKLPEKKWRRGTSIYMFWFRFIPEMSSALSAAFLYGRAFVCFSACLAVHYFAVYTGLVCFKN